jgi:lipid-A-disaccharide synthase-like uncharacterized protein
VAPALGGHTTTTVSFMTFSEQTIWLTVGFSGQALFGLRFLVQWLYSESQGRSVIPPAFWYFSIAGGLVLLCYAIHKRELVFIVGEFITLMIFIRNLYMLRRGSSDK